MSISSSSPVLWSSAQLHLECQHSTGELQNYWNHPSALGFSDWPPTRRPKQDAILPLEYFTLGTSTADNYWVVFFSHNVGHFNVCNILNICDGDLHHPFGGLLLSLAPLLQPVWQGQPYQSLHTWQHSSQDHKEALPTCQDHIIPTKGDK